MSPWKKHYEINHVSSRLQEARQITPEGKVQFNALTGFDSNLAVIVSAYVWHPDIPLDERFRLARQAVFTAGIDGDIEPTRLESHIHSQEVSFLQQPFRRYVLVTSMSFDQLSTLPRVRIGDCVICFEPRLKSSFHIAQSQLMDGPYEDYPSTPDSYLYVRVFTSGRSASDAVARAFGSLDLIRGIWNLGNNLKKGWRASFGSTRKPVNDIVLGPLHTLHYPNGKIASRLWWFEPHFAGPLQPFRPQSSIDRMRLFERRVRKNISRLSYREQIEDAIVRYGRALDKRDWRDAFLQMWSVLEDVTFTENDRYDVTIQRATFLWNNSRYDRQVLLHLRDMRNSFVHESSSSDATETLMYDLKRYVERLLMFHLRTGHRFKSKEDVRQFLDLPHDSTLLNDRLSLLSKAARFRSGKPLGR